MASLDTQNPDSISHVKMTAPAVRSQPVHLALAVCSSVLLTFSVIAAPRGAMSSGKFLMEATVLLLPGLLIAPAIFHERGAWDRREAALVLPWTLVLAALVTQAAPTAVSHAFPLRDDLWRNIDMHLGISVPAIMAFTDSHPLLASLLRFSYYWTLHPIMLLAMFLPPLLGKRVAAQRFVLVNALAFVLALPCMLLLPAIGPWVAWHFPPNIAQRAIELNIVSLRRGIMSSADSFGGIICFPSFHVFWAVVSAQALQPFRVLRYPAILVAALVTISTVTTGWHYGVDVIGGLLLVAVTTYIASLLVASEDSPRRRSDV